jgi:hypothetical protein
LSSSGGAAAASLSSGVAEGRAGDANRSTARMMFDSLSAT